MPSFQVWEQRQDRLYYVDCVSDCLVKVLTVLHYGHILIVHGLSFIDAFILLDLRLVLRALRVRVEACQRYAALRSRLRSHLRDADVAELHRRRVCVYYSFYRLLLTRSQDEVCAVCREEMLCAKQLPCGHAFHALCLRSWLELNPTCPTCRLSLAYLFSTARPG